MVEACLTIPGWDFILTQPQYMAAIEAHIKRFQWIDYYLCNLLYPDLSELSYAQAHHAVLYHKRQELFIRTRFNPISRTFCYQEMRMFFHKCTQLLWRYHTRHIVCTSNVQSATESLIIIVVC
ncbi:hypothetical protein ACTXT7_007884 [Hymenolepis weldensis]